MKNANNNKSFKYMVVGVVIMIITATITAITFGYFINTINELGQKNSVRYKQHYAFVVEDSDSEFWDQVYESAYEEALKDDIYLEDIKDSLKVNYSSEDLLRVAINSSVDGILYAGRYSNGVENLINVAAEKGICVVVLHNDIETSKRQCFVGVNNYELGQIYASQIVKMLDGEDMSTSTIALLVSKDMSEGATNLILMAIEDYLLEYVEEDNVPQMEIIRIEAEDTFSVEEDIRNLFVTDDKLPEIVLCLESSYTQCAYQAVVDYNHVGEVQIIGYFANEDILDAIDKEIIYSTVSIDTVEMGKESIMAIKEYNNMGYTNSFMPVDMEIIDKKNVNEKMQKSSTDEVNN